MATTPTWLQQLQGGQSYYTDPESGMTYMPTNSSGYNPYESVGGMYAVGNYAPNAQYSVYDAQGNDTGAKGNYGFRGNFMEDYLPYIAAFLAAGAGAAALGGGAAGAGGAAAGGAMGPLTAAETLAANNALAQSLAPYLSAGSAMGPITASQAATQNAALASQLSPYAATGAAGAGAAGAGGAGGAGGGAGATGGAGGGLSGLLSGGSSLLGPAATVIGGLLGSKPQEQSASSERKLPDYLQGPVANDLIPRVQGLLAQQQPLSLEAQQQLMNTGKGLLNFTPAGNGFDRFTRGRY